MWYVIGAVVIAVVALVRMASCIEQTHPINGTLQIRKLNWFDKYVVFGIIGLPVLIVVSVIAIIIKLITHPFILFADWRREKRWQAQKQGGV